MRIYGYGIAKSMLIAFRNFLRPAITVQYPHERVELPERSRWAVAMKYDEDGLTKCTACLACERACPDFVIQLEITTAEDRSKHIDHWRYEIGACMMCGLCVEACPFDAILMSHEYELARTDPGTLAIELLTDVLAASGKWRVMAPALQASVPATVPPTRGTAPASTTDAGGGADD